MLPEEGNSEREEALNDVSTAVEMDYEECPSPRTNQETRAVWERYKEVGKLPKRIQARRKSVGKENGITRRSLTGKVSLDFVQSIPYDLMHSLLLGWVKLVTSLVLGRHSKESDVKCHFVPHESTQIRINASPGAGSQAVPESWERPPSSFEYIYIRL